MIKNKQILYSIIFIAILFLAVKTFGFNREILQVQIKKFKEKIQLNVFLPNGYGLQRSAPHWLDVYALSPFHDKECNFEKKIKNFGRKITRVKQFDGRVATQDPKYFDFIKKKIIKVPVSINNFAVKGSLYYCSFAEKFCSMQKIEFLYEKSP